MFTPNTAEGITYSVWRLGKCWLRVLGQAQDRTFLLLLLGRKNRDNLLGSFPLCCSYLAVAAQGTGFLITELRCNVFQDVFLEVLRLWSNAMKIRRFCKAVSDHNVLWVAPCSGLGSSSLGGSSWEPAPHSPPKVDSQCPEGVQAPLLPG